ncbi:hypothetical protein B8A32_12220 [Loigolactobacillus backii]|nr:hypothetical protein B8A32_12220 [Loigolactobacillus backii]
MFFVQTNHTRKELLFLMFLKINLRNHSSLHKLFYSLCQHPREVLFWGKNLNYKCAINIDFICKEKTLYR